LLCGKEPGLFPNKEFATGLWGEAGSLAGSLADEFPPGDFPPGDDGPEFCTAFTTALAIFDSFFLRALAAVESFAATEFRPFDISFADLTAFANSLPELAIAAGGTVAFTETGAGGGTLVAM
jgi:hypothetical protein